MNQQEAIIELQKHVSETGALRAAVVEQLGVRLFELATLVSGVIGAGGKLLIAGNGGSATMSSHFAAEMIVRLTSDRNRQSLPAMSLSADIGIVTAAGNDYGFENIFARQVEGLGNKGDLLIVMSTSGNSTNLIRAVETAKKKNMISAALLGGNGGKLAKMIERPLVVPHPSPQRIQEEHLFLIHQLVDLIERDLFV